MTAFASASLKRLLLVSAAVFVVALALPAVASARIPSGNHAGSARVTERDFHISAPARLRAGDMRLTVKNLGPENHELLVVRGGSDALPLRADGLTVDEKMLEPRLAGMLEAGSAGSTRTLHVHLRPGRYEMFCNMSGHYLGGMHARLLVTR
ncbi:MAG: hypothetical protein ACXVJW_03705 [Acidimicrobiia bacterium]